MNSKKRGLWYDLYRQGIKNPEDFIKNEYLNGKSGQEIVEYLDIRFNISTTAKTVQDWAKKGNYLRSFSEAKRLAMSRGRMIYVKKPINERYKTKSISSGIRYKVLIRDGSRCTMCGWSVKDGAELEVHHINGEESTPDNLITLCFECHRGLHQQQN